MFGSEMYVIAEAAVYLTEKCCWSHQASCCLPLDMPVYIVNISNCKSYSKVTIIN